jgi:hypothetical protein
MELKTEKNQVQGRDNAIINQAIGCTDSSYQPSADNLDCGVLVT